MYERYQIMRHMGWSEPELDACSEVMYRNIIRFMNTEAKFEQESRQKQ